LQVVRDPFRPVDLPLGGVVTVGNFDGVHRGHREMLLTVAASARRLGAPAVVVTFDPHPLKVLHPERAPKMIQTLRQREEAIEACGIDALVIVPFTRDFSLTPAEVFIRDLLVERLEARELRVGEHFIFGKERGGNIEMLRRIGAEAGFRVEGLADVSDPGGAISSTRIRNALAGGEVREAAALLGRPYAMDGIIARGDRMGRKIGFPTMNLNPDNELFPRDGVYFTSVRIDSFGRTFPSVTNIGRRPTVYEDFATTIESYVLDFSSDVYGERMRLQLFDRVRDEKTFASLPDLTAQIRLDVEAARGYFMEHPLS
jgi:riboflavin kinase / FMN adenylyltransferase